jgi:hypothetical protein
MVREDVEIPPAANTLFPVVDIVQFIPSNE